MALEKSLLSSKRKKLIEEIRDNHLHSDDNRMMFLRWLNYRMEGIRQGLINEMNNSGKELPQSLLVSYMDEPFNIDDIKDEDLKSCIWELDRMEAEMLALDNAGNRTDVES